MTEKVEVGSREFSAKLGPLVFSLEWRLTLFTLLLFPFLVNLGFWQLERADEKRLLANRHAERMALPPMSLDDLALAIEADGEDLSTLADRHVAFTAEFVTHQYLLLDNRLRDGRFGYELIALARGEQRAVAINLGWIAGDPSRRSQPDVVLPKGPRSLSGRLYIPTADAYVLADEAVPSVFPAVVQSFPAKRYASALSDRLGVMLLPVEIRITENHPLANRADWPVVNQSPEKHTGYAVQWFTMAGVLIIAFLLRSSNIGALLWRRSAKQS